MSLPLEAEACGCGQGVAVGIVKGLTVGDLTIEVVRFFFIASRKTEKAGCFGI